MAEITQDVFDKWYGTATNAKAAKQSSEALLENEDPLVVANARANLESLINQQHPGSVDGNSRPEMIFYFSGLARKTLEDSATAQFETNVNGLLDFALKNKADHLQAGYVSIKAYDAKHKQIASLDDPHLKPLDAALPFHYVVSRLEDEIKEFTKDEPKSGRVESLLKHVKNTYEVVELELRLHLANTMQLKGEDAEKLAKAFMQSYVRTPDRVPYIARAAAQRAYSVLEKLVPEGQRAAYAHALLKAKVNAGDKAGASSDLHDVLSFQLEKK